MGEDEEFMLLALKELEKGVKKKQSPFGAVIVCKGKVVSSAHNTVVGDKDPSAHAELNAIQAAGKKLKKVHFKGCTIYSTCEPCPMCFSAIHWAGIERIVYGASIADAEACGFRELSISNKRMRSLGGAKLEIKGGVLRDECIKAMKKWKKRKDKRVY